MEWWFDLQDNHASYTEQVSSPSSREERIQSPKNHYDDKILEFAPILLSSKEPQETYGSHQLFAGTPAWLSGARRNQSFASQRFHLTFPFNGWREKGKIAKGFLSRPKKLQICGAIKGSLPFSTKHRDQAGLTPKTTTSPHQLCWMQKRRPVLPRGTRHSYLFIGEWEKIQREE